MFDQPKIIGMSMGWYIRESFTKDGESDKIDGERMGKDRSIKGARRQCANQS